MQALDAAGVGMGVYCNGADYVWLEGFEIKNAQHDAITLYSDAATGHVRDRFAAERRAAAAPALGSREWPFLGNPGFASVFRQRPDRGAGCTVFGRTTGAQFIGLLIGGPASTASQIVPLPANLGCTALQSTFPAMVARPSGSAAHAGCAAPCVRSASSMACREDGRASAWNRGATRERPRELQRHPGMLLSSRT